jgi:hypothetical protein
MLPTVDSNSRKSPMEWEAAPARSRSRIDMGLSPDDSA